MARQMSTTYAVISGETAVASTALRAASSSAGPATGRIPAECRSRGLKPAAWRVSTPISSSREEGDGELQEEAVELGLGQGVRALVLDRVHGGGDEERLRQLAGVPSTVTWRSSIASRREDWVLGGVRLISSARRRLVKTGPFWNENSAVRAS